MEMVLLLEVAANNEVIIYSPEDKLEYTLTVTNDQSELYNAMLEDAADEEDVYVLFDRENRQLVFAESEEAI